ncbi:MAG: aminofutalosine synthase MqnE [Peptococcaceae bacterium]|jgi:aminodeoxyfutalosine synthase|nr:aminofutalosine synthase MqnE [Peptococcaceae bacterium]
MKQVYGDEWLAGIREKILAGERLDRADGIGLFGHPDLLAVGELAALVNARKNGDRVRFIVNRHVNPTNVCVNLCPLCAFGRPAGAADAYTMSAAEVDARVAGGGAGITEVHMVAGLNPALGLDYYLDLVERVRRLRPGVLQQSFTAVEIDFLAAREGLGIEEVLRRFKLAGLTSLPGGGAEVFSPRVRALVCPKKISGERWLEVHETAHRLGLPTNATMLYGHVETIGERVDHLLDLRALQDRTGGFLAFIPLAFHPRNTALAGQNGFPGPTGVDDLRMLAGARLILDNFDHVKAFWIMIGPKLAQVSLSFGVDDLDGTVVEERITHAAGAGTEEGISRAELERLIRAAGKIPVERDTLYNAVGEAV